METVKVELDVAKGALEIGQGLSALMVNIKASLKDGFQPGSDLPAIVVESLQPLIAAVQGVQVVAAEAKEDSEKFSDGVYCGLKSGVFALLKD